MDFVGKGRINFSACQFVVLDEADRMLDMGFMPEMEKLFGHETMAPKVYKLLTNKNLFTLCCTNYVGLNFRISAKLSCFQLHFQMKYKDLQENL